MSTPRRVLMCPPGYYEIPAIENIRMDTNVQPDTAKAWRQWTAIVNIYTKLGLQVNLIEPVPRFWSMVFAANGAWGRTNSTSGKREAALSNYRLPIRRDEKEFHRRMLEFLGYECFELPEGIYFEGQGDVVTLSDAYLFGYGFRSSPEAAKFISRFMELEKPVVPIEMISPEFYHLDTCVMSLRGSEEEGLVYYPPALHPESLDRIRSLDIRYKFEVASPALAMALACNSVFVNDTILLNVPSVYSGASFARSEAAEPLTDSGDDTRYREITYTCPDYAALIKFFWRMNYNIIPVYTSEFMKSTGGVRCMTLFLD